MEQLGGLVQGEEVFEGEPLHYAGGEIVIFRRIDSNVMLHRDDAGMLGFWRRGQKGSTVPARMKRQCTVTTVRVGLRSARHGHEQDFIVSRCNGLVDRKPLGANIVPVFSGLAVCTSENIEVPGTDPLESSRAASQEGTSNLEVAPRPATSGSFAGTIYQMCPRVRRYSIFVISSRIKKSVSGEFHSLLLFVEKV